MESLDLYDIRPKEMLNYLKYNGLHFNRKLCEYAISLMRKANNTKIIPYDKDHLDSILKKYSIELKNNVLYDYVYVANMCKADFLGSSIEDEKHLALFVKDMIEDPDAPDGFIFNRWYADCCRAGIPIDWEEFI